MSIIKQLINVSKANDIKNDILTQEITFSSISTGHNSIIIHGTFTLEDKSAIENIVDGYNDNEN